MLSIDASSSHGVYGPFECERILGDAIAGFRNDVVITSKCGWNIDPVTGQRVHAFPRE